MATELHLSPSRRLQPQPAASVGASASTSAASQLHPMFAGMSMGGVVGIGGMQMFDQLDPHLLALATNSGVLTPPLDPALFAIEQVVNDVNRGRIGAAELAIGMETRHVGVEDGSSAAAGAGAGAGTGTERLAEPVPVPETESIPQVPVQIQIEPAEEVAAVHVDLAPDAEAHLDDDGIDPALREIVNSLTNAQQSHHPALSADADGGERDRIDHEAIRSTLEDYAVQNGFGSYSAIFGGTFAPSPHTQNLLLPSLDAEGQQPEPADDARDDGEVEAEAHAHAHAHSHAHTHEHAHPAPPPPDTSVPLHLPAKRGRGRPKGSKNKPKPRPPTPDPPSDPEPEPPRRKKGRPPKIRSEEEIAEIERRKEEKELGIKRKRGRPRKYPELGLVREMRLKKNREAVQEKIRMLEERRLAAAPVEGLPLDQAGLPEVGGQVEVVHQSHEHEHPGSHNHGHDEHDDHVDHADYDWPYQDGQTLLDVVRGVGMDMGDGERMSVGMGVLSGTSNGGVFSLADVTPTAS